LDLEVTALGHIALHVGAGYGGDPDWGHGRWRGRGWGGWATADRRDPPCPARVPFGAVAPVAGGRPDGEGGWALLGPATVGRHVGPARPGGRRAGPPRRRRPRGRGAARPRGGPGPPRARHDGRPRRLRLRRLGRGRSVRALWPGTMCARPRRA